MSETVSRWPLDVRPVLAAAALVLGAGCADVRPPVPFSPEQVAVANDTSVDAPRVAQPNTVTPVRAPNEPSRPETVDESRPTELGVEPAHVASRAKKPAPGTSNAQAAPPDDYLLPLPATPADAPASVHAAMSDAACAREIEKRGLPFERSKQAAAGVSSAWRITGPLRGVKFVTPAAPSLFGVIDCRLALALDDLAVTLAAHGVVGARVDNFYRPNAHLPGKAKKSQHAYAMAIDLMSLELSDGTKLTPPDDWHAPIGSVSCGPDAVLESTDRRAVALRNIVCDVARSGAFHHLLTPSYNAAHQSHFHFDIAKDVKSVMTH